MHPVSYRSGRRMADALLATALALAVVPGGRGARAQVATRAARAGVDVLDYQLTVDLPDRGAAIEGRAVVTVRRAATADSLVLDLVGLRVDSVLVDERPVRFARDAATVRIALPSARDSADTLRVTVRYGGAPRDGLVISTDSLGRWLAFGDNWPTRARYWIPSVDDPSDKATVTWIVRAPIGRRVVANGALVEETPIPNSDRVVTRWRESRPIPVYLMVIAAAPWARYEIGPTACGLAELPGCVRQSVYVAPEVRDFLPGPFARAGAMVELFARLVAPFPYEKLDHLQSATRFGGMENASAIFYSNEGFRRRTMGEGVVAHETAHQWFGDAVTEREWPHVWLSEGFATYFAALWTRHAAGDTAFRREMARLRGQIIAAPEARTRPVIDTAQTDLLALLNANSYQKGAWTLHMLRALVGDTAFFRGVRRYYLVHRHGTALTSDLRAAVEATAGVRLDWFFDQWLRRPGWVEVSATWHHDPAGRRLALHVEQGTRFAPYRFPLTVLVTDDAGRDVRIRVEVPAERAADLSVPLAPGTRPVRVTLDPDVEVLGTVAVREGAAGR